VELLVVIAIIAVLATIILPGMGNIRKKANILKCAKNLSGLYNGLVQYEGEYKSYPTGATGASFWNLLRDVTKYTDSTPPLKRSNGLYICPMRGGAADVGDSIATCHYRGPASDLTYAFDDASPIGADEEANHNPKGKKSINVLTYGGKVGEVTEGSLEWSELEPSDDNPGVTK
jgi:type II secretory pathway pseudopilin PulG